MRPHPKRSETTPIPPHPPMQAVYQLPTAEDEDPCSSMPLALQTLFYKV